jgi:hypothetical protein
VKRLNKKAILLVSVVLGIVLLVPLAAAAPFTGQNQNGDTLQTQDRLQTQDCVNSVAQAGNNTCLQSQDQQCLQTRNCTNDCTCIANCTGTQTQLRLQESNQACNINMYQHGNLNQNQYQQRNKAP